MRNEMKTKIRIERRYDNDNEYIVNIDTTKDMTKEEYASLVSAIKQIQATFDIYIDMLFAKNKAKKEKK